MGAFMNDAVEAMDDEGPCPEGEQRHHPPGLVAHPEGQQELDRHTGNREQGGQRAGAEQPPQLRLGAQDRQAPFAMVQDFGHRDCLHRDGADCLKSACGGHF